MIASHEEQEQMSSETIEGYEQTSQTVRGLHAWDQADQLRELTQRGLHQTGQADDHIVRVAKQPNGTFDLLVFRRIQEGSRG